MNKKFIPFAIAGCLTMAVPAMAAAEDVADEIESNEPVVAAQRVTIRSDLLSINGAIGNLSGVAVYDLDYFTFYGQAGDVVTLDIDGGVGGVRNVDTIVAIFGPAPDFEMLRYNDDAPLDPGSNSTMDSRIDNFRLPNTGYYIVGVSNYPRYFANGGITTATSFNTYNHNNGDYKLLISGVSETETIQHVNINIKPGNNEVAPINPKSKGKIPVAILSSNEFNATSIDTTTLRFGATGYEESLSHCAKNGVDINSDGRLDLMCHFENQKAGFEPGDLEGILRAESSDGKQVEGRSVLKVVPQKRM